MTYELAKELKDAGFHQYRVLGYPWKCSNGITYIVEHDGLRPANGMALADDTAVRIPILSELIGACNPMKSDDFGLRLKGDVWEAWFIYVGYFEGFPKEYYDEDGCAALRLEVEGQTHEEAVARLWLALNPKEEIKI